MAELLLDTHALNGTDAVAQIKALQATPEQLKAIHEHEKKHPTYENGRRGVLNALEERLGETRVAMAGGEPNTDTPPQTPAPEAAPTDELPPEEAEPEAAAPEAPPLEKPQDAEPGPGMVFELADVEAGPGPGDTVLVTDAAGMTHQGVLVDYGIGAVIRLNDDRDTELFVRRDERTVPLSWRARG
jgi:hypothetical protein